VSDRFAALLAEFGAALPGGDDGAHDLAHLRRVWANARRIAEAEGGDGEVLAAAVLLHDCVAVEKSSPLRGQASRLAADRAGALLAGRGWPAGRVDAVAHAIAAHSFSAGIAPGTLEARILQDADRLDAIGYVGIARCFYTAGRLGSALYHADDPAAAQRPLDDRAYALDHFRAKLLKLADGFQTATGARLAAERTGVLAAFVAGFEAEIG
jgi:uncharacterized protein